MSAYGIQINPYDPFVANAMINGKQMTITWNVDDLKQSHESAFEITMFATYLSGIYGTQLTVHSNEVHDYLGMDLVYSEKGNVKVLMIKYLDKVLKEFPEDIRLPIVLPSAEYLFLVRENEEAMPLPERQKLESSTI